MRTKEHIQGVAVIAALALSAVSATLPQVSSADGIRVYSARSGDIKFSATVVTNVVVEGEWGPSKTEVTNIVYTIVTPLVASATNELDKIIIDRGYLTEHQSLQPAMDYADLAVSAEATRADQAYQPAGEYVVPDDLEGYATTEWVEAQGYVTQKEASTFDSLTVTNTATMADLVVNNSASVNNITVSNFYMMGTDESDDGWYYGLAIEKGELVVRKIKRQEAEP